MCGRYALADLDDRFSRRFNVAQAVTLRRPRYNISPTQTLAVVVRVDSENQAVPMVWGLVPSWSKEPKGYLNARAETVSTRPSFRMAYRTKRCLIPASSYFEWQQTQSGRMPYCIKLKDGELFAFAGIYDEWINPQGQPIQSFAILTCTANQLLRPIHDRMPVILKPEDEELWLDPHTEVPSLNQLLRPYPTESMEAYPVSRAVNDPANDNPELIKPVPA